MKLLLLMVKTAQDIFFRSSLRLQSQLLVDWSKRECFFKNKISKSQCRRAFPWEHQITKSQIANQLTTVSLLFF